MFPLDYSSPYLVKFHLEIKKCLDYAIQNGLYQKYYIPEDMVLGYIENHRVLPIWVVELACKVNSKNILVPYKYQHLWYCLHGVHLIKFQPSGRSFLTKVSFSSCYLKLDSNLEELIFSAKLRLNYNSSQFSVLCNYKNRKYWIKTIPLTVILKSCQILGKEPWEFLKGYELFGKSSKKGKIVIPYEQDSLDVKILCIWLRTDGHLELASTHIEINQQNNLHSLVRLKNLFQKIFKINPRSSIYAKGHYGEDRLIFSSSPLSQFIVLRYQIPLGYKTGSLEKMDFEGLIEEHYWNLLAAFVQTEGCLSYHYTRGKKKRLPRFEFLVMDKAIILDCFYVLNRLGFQPKFYNQKGYKLGIYDSKETLRLVNGIRAFVLNDNKIQNLEANCKNG